MLEIRGLSFEKASHRCNSNMKMQDVKNGKNTGCQNSEEYKISKELNLLYRIIRICYLLSFY